jgi:uncharacterized membrane protein
MDRPRLHVMMGAVSERTLVIRRPIGIGIFLLVTGAVGLYGAVRLTIDEFVVAGNPHAQLSCDVNPFVSCSDVMASWQGHLFGFPNPILGVMGFVAPIAVGVLLLFGAVVQSKGFWTLFNAGVFLAWVFVTWLFVQTVFSIGRLCPWCMLVWSVTIPMFWIFTIWNLRNGNLPFGRAGRRIGAELWPFSWAFVLVNYMVIVIVIIVHFPTLLSLLF